MFWQHTPVQQDSPLRAILLQICNLFSWSERVLQHHASLQSSTGYEIGRLLAHLLRHDSCCLASAFVRSCSMLCEAFNHLMSGERCQPTITNFVKNIEYQRDQLVLLCNLPALDICHRSLCQTVFPPSESSCFGARSKLATVLLWSLKGRLVKATNESVNPSIHDSFGNPFFCSFHSCEALLCFAT